MMSDAASAALDPTQRDHVRAAVLAAAAAPQKLADLKRTAKSVVKKDKKAAEAIVAELVAAGELHKHGSAKSAPYGVDKPPLKNDAEKVRAALIAAADLPQTLANLIKAAVSATNADKAFVQGEADKLVADEQLHKHGTAKSPPYGAKKPTDPNDAEKVRAALLTAAETPQTLAKLVAAAVFETKAAKEFVTREANSLIAAERLHKQSDAAKAPYGTTKPVPPHVLDVAPGKTAFAALVKAAQKVCEVAPSVSLDEVMQRLCAALGSEVAKPEVISPSVAPPVSPPAVVNPKPEGAAPQLTPERIRAALKDAYGELILYPEFEDKLVEIRRLYHEASRALPGLTVPQFHRELEHLQSQRRIELHGLNEVQHAQEPELALRRNDRLLYYVMWGK